MSSELLIPLLNEIRVPTQQDKIYKDECILSFDTPDSPEGIFVCMKTFFGFSRPFVQMYHDRTGARVFLKMRRIARPIVAAIKSGSSSDEESKPKVTKLALNMDGGFQTNEPKFEYEEINTVVLLPEFVEIPLNLPDLPEKVFMTVSGILSADSAGRQAELDAMKNTWDGEKKQVSKHAESLLQLDNSVKVPPCGWKCSKCDIREGLWLNLTDGTILCGRKYFDGTGGNNHAEEHYRATKYPLVVKLGTITASGGDVYSYDEDNMVEDPKLAAHLLHFGINVSSMQKTEKSMIEMEIDLNQRYDEWSIIQEDGCQLKSVFGPGFTGLVNLGNSCYLNSIMQVLFNIPDFITEFNRPDKNVQFREANHADPTGDLRTQLTKLASGLQSGEYSKQNAAAPNEQAGIKPRMFKSLIGKNHPEFKSKRQQDAQEFFLHVLDAIERLPNGSVSNGNGGGGSGSGSGGAATPNGHPTDCFKFEVEERIECGQSAKVRYTSRSDFLLSLPIVGVPVQNQEQYDTFLETKAAVEAAGGKIEGDQVIRPIVKLTDSIKMYSQDGHIDEFFSPAIKAKTFAKTRTRLRTFPDYLVLHMKKFTLGADWTPKKLDVALEVPDILDISDLKALGQLPHEVLMPEDAPASAAPRAQAFEPNADYIVQLRDMGFMDDGIRRALYHTKNGGVEQAMNWIFEHMNDPDFNAPFVVPAAEQASPEPVFLINEDSLLDLINMGIQDHHARLALKMNNNNAERAVEWIFTNIGNIEQLEREQEQKERAASVAAASAPNQTYRNGPSRYRLMGMVSHMGQSTMCGHYVAHIRKQIRPDTVIAVNEPKPGLTAPGVAATPDTVVGSGGTQSPSKSPVPPTAAAPGSQSPIPTTASTSTSNPEPNSYQWIIFNDSKVAISEKPPTKFAYLYFYKRMQDDEQ